MLPVRGMGCIGKETVQLFSLGLLERICWYTIDAYPFAELNIY